MSRRASCACGGLSITVEGDPVRISMCHCLECQRRTGGPFSAQARWPEDRVTITGPSTVYERTGDSGGVLHQHFCPRCGSTVHYTISALPGLVAVPIGAFADPTFPAPTVSVYEARRHPWVSVSHATEHYD